MNYWFVKAAVKKKRNGKEHLYAILYKEDSAVLTRYRVWCEINSTVHIVSTSVEYILPNELNLAIFKTENRFYSDMEKKKDEGYKEISPQDISRKWPNVISGVEMYFLVEKLKE
jgi:hypothetical protein